MSITALRSSPFQPCIPTRATKVPAGPDWLHEIKHDGYRLMVQRAGDRVRLFTRQGFDWSDRFPLISEAARRLRAASFVIDGEAVWLDAGGMSDFNKLHSRKHDTEVKLVAFDLLEVSGKDARIEPLRARKALLEMLLARTDGDGIQLSEYLEGEIGPRMFEHACKMGLEGIVSKHRERAYHAGRCSHWLKVKTRPLRR
ncbi:MAG: hypothetical protein ACM3JD_00490 [Rudaea sp.]